MISNLVHPSSPIPSATTITLRSSSRFIPVRSSLPFTPEKAKYFQELKAAVTVVEKACRLCVDVKQSLSSGDGKILEKNDRTPVTVADFSVQALVSLELNRAFPSIPLVAEEDASSLRSTLINSAETSNSSFRNNSIVDSILSVVSEKADPSDKCLTHDDVLEAIDRGGKTVFDFGSEPSTYWVLDPIDGTRGFLKGSEALYVVGLALVVEREIALGVMGCPNWNDDTPFSKDSFSLGVQTGVSESGLIMISHVGCGTWMKKFSRTLDGWVLLNNVGWSRCYVDECSYLHEARFCIPDSQSWESLPFSSLYNTTVDSNNHGDKPKVGLFPTCCGSLCKYLMVASGRASIFILRARRQTVIKVWDHAVGIICVHEAGGQVTDWKGHQLDLGADEVGRRVIIPSGGVLVTNDILHDQVLKIISYNS